MKTLLLDRIQFRKLENGYTVKYHVADGGAPPGEQNSTGFVKELYCVDKTVLTAVVSMLIEKFLDVEVP